MGYLNYFNVYCVSMMSNHNPKSKHVDAISLCYGKADQRTAKRRDTWFIMLLMKIRSLTVITKLLENKKKKNNSSTLNIKIQFCG